MVVIGVKIGVIKGAENVGEDRFWIGGLVQNLLVLGQDNNAL